MTTGKKVHLLLFLILALALFSMPAFAESLVPEPFTRTAVNPLEVLETCMISGHIDAEPNMDAPEMGDWKYTLTLVWDSGERYALSHWNLFLDESHYHCAPEEILDAIQWANPAGYGEGEDGCQVVYDAYLEARGDPSIDLEGVILKFEPMSAGCEPGPAGEAVVVFYSDDSPAPILMPNAFLSDKAGRTICFGEVTGVFPGLACDPTANRASSWGNLKAIYNDWR